MFKSTFEGQTLFTILKHFKRKLSHPHGDIEILSRLKDEL